MKTTQSQKRMLAGALLSAGVALAGSGLSTGVAAAEVQPTGPFTWCPGDAPVPTGNIRVNPVIWDENVCHDYWYVYHGQGNVAQNIWEGPNPPGPPPGRDSFPAADSAGLVLGPLPALSMPVTHPFTGAELSPLDGGLHCGDDLFGGDHPMGEEAVVDQSGLIAVTPLGVARSRNRVADHVDLETLLE